MHARPYSVASTSLTSVENRMDYGTYNYSSIKTL